jgi:signal transduction histidine kinase
VRDSEGVIVGGVVAQTDITALVGAEKALRQADARKDEFLAMLAHELRNPLAPISSAADLLNLAVLDNNGVKRTGELIKRQVRHLTALVDDLLDVSRVTRGLVGLDMQQVEISDVLSSAVEQVSPLIQAKGQHLTLSGAGQSESLLCDRKRMVQIVANLLNNAMKYTSSGGAINVDVELQRDALIIIVSDNGIGMTSETLEHVFELFAQAKRTSDRTQGGLGIGLALVRRLVELHGGKVFANSPGLGRGSVFTIALPRAPDVSQCEQRHDV